MAEYNFTMLVELKSVAEDIEQHIEALLQGGCDDATIALGKRGYLHLDFSRDAASGEHAVMSAISDVERVVIGSRVVALGPDLVGMTELAELYGCTRQNMRIYATSASKAEARFPPPATDGAVAAWHLAEVSEWFQANTNLNPRDSRLAEIAKYTFVANRHLQELRLHGDTSPR